MSHFQNILFVGQALPGETAALRQALALGEGGARFSALVLCPPLPNSLSAYRERYRQFLADELRKDIKDLGHASPGAVDIQVVSGRAPAVKVVGEVLDRGCDLVVKQVEATARGRGFRSLDMNLLRDCPCPLWLCRKAADDGTAHGKIAVAIDPHAETDEEKALSYDLLRLGRVLADREHNRQLHVVGCGELAYEEYLRNSVFSRVTDDDVIAASLSVQRHDRTHLETLVNASGIAGDVKIDLLRGEPDQRIPEYIADNEIGLLVMGTVARTGIPGFVIGNTAENLLQKIDCSLLAVKPRGFVSPLG
ncbi:universal stress protein [Proteobacteria bacterium 005FR1]|nr:universal stress protein [Proteobacteria bacterium 005FR1]